MPLDPPRQSIDYGQPRLDGGTVLGEDRAGNRGCEDDAPAFLQTDEGVSPDRIVRGTTRPGDCGQPAAIGEPRQGRRDMAQGGVGHAAIDVRDGREWRVHQHDVWCDTDVEMIVDVCGVEARHRGAGKRRERSPARVSASSLRTSDAPDSSARMASRPVPAEGSSTMSAGVIAAAALAASPSMIGVLNC
jgi:hypothetical protein